VESVAWIAERKDVLSTFFWMLTLGAYSYYVESPGWKRYVFVLLFFVLGLLSKPMLITLPFVMLLLDFWPLQRFQAVNPDNKIQAEVPKLLTSDKQKKKSKTKQVAAVKQTPAVQKTAAPEYSWSRIYPLLWEKVPLFVLAILSSIVTFFAAQSVGTVASIAEVPLGIRIGNAFISYVTYIGKTIWPINLAVVYPHSPGGLPLWQVLGSVLLLVAITLVVIWRAKKSLYLATGWLWYLGTLVPVIGIVQVGPQAMADRYTYISLIGLFVIAAWGFSDLLKRWRYRKAILLTLSILIILGLSIKTWTQVGYWQDSVTLFDHTLKVTDHNWFAYFDRGNAHKDLGHYVQAIEDYNKAIEIRSNYAEAYNNRGITHAVLGNHRHAIEDYNKAIEIKSNYAEAYYNRGITHAVLGNHRHAIEDYNKVIEIKPGEAMPYNNRGNAHKALGHYKQAIDDYNRAIEIKPSEAIFYNNRGNAYKDLDNFRQAIEDYNRAIEIKSNYADAYNNRGIAYAVLGNYRQAIEDFSRTIEIMGRADAYYNRGRAYFDLGNYRQAIEDYNKAIEIKPDYEDAYINRGVAYAQLGDINLSINDFKMAAKHGSERAKNFLKSQGINW